MTVQNQLILSQESVLASEYKLFQIFLSKFDILYFNLRQLDINIAFDI